MQRFVNGLVGLVLAVPVSACSATVSPGDPARAVAQDFYTAVARSDHAAACALLAPEVRSSLEQSTDQPCKQALPGERPSAGSH